MPEYQITLWGDFMKNTAIEFSYTDYGGWSASNRVVIAGEMTKEMIESMKAKLLHNMCFSHPDPEKYGQIIPGQIALPDLQDRVGNPGRSWDEDDHIFHVVDDISLTDDEPTLSSAYDAEFVHGRIMEIKWDLIGYQPPLMQADMEVDYKPGSGI
jgi:hypothetical protein